MKVFRFSSPHTELKQPAVKWALWLPYKLDKVKDISPLFYMNSLQCSDGILFSVLTEDIISDWRSKTETKQMFSELKTYSEKKGSWPWTKKRRIKEMTA